MKRTGIIAAAMTLVLMIAGCGSKTTSPESATFATAVPESVKAASVVSDTASEVAVQVIAATDAYLDGTVSYEDTSVALMELIGQIEYVDDLDDTDVNKWADKDVQGYITLIRADMSKYNHNNDDESYNEIVAERNNLAEKVGAELR